MKLCSRMRVCGAANAFTAAVWLSCSKPFMWNQWASVRKLPYGSEGMNSEIDTVTHHRMPLTVALSARFRVTPRWWLDTSIRYTLLASQTRIGNTYLFQKQQQRIHYLGLSVGVGCELWHSNRWSFYAAASLACDFPLRSSIETTYWQGTLLIDSERSSLSARAQWSLGLGLGLQYSLTPAVGFFFEPTLQYNFRTSDGINTWRTAHPLSPILPLGLRITF